MEIDDEAIDYMDEDPMVLMLREEGTHWEPPVIVEAMTELKNCAWEGATHPMEDSVKKIKTVKLVTLAKNIVSVPIESIFASITIPVKSVYDSIPIESESVKSIESDFAYFLALNVLFLKLVKKLLIIGN